MLDSSTSDLLVRFKVCKTFPMPLGRSSKPTTRKHATSRSVPVRIRNFWFGSNVPHKGSMQRLGRFVLSLSLSLLSVSFARAQDASKIIDQYIKSAGGAKALSRLQTFAVDGNVANTRDSQPGTFTFMVKQPNRYYSELRSQGKIFIESYNGKSAWHNTDAGEISTLLGPQALEMEAAAQYYNSRLQALAKKKIGVAYKGQVSVRGRDAYQVELTYPTGVQRDVFFDPQSHLIVKEKGSLAGIPREIYYDDYRAVNTLKVVVINL